MRLRSPKTNGRRGASHSARLPMNYYRSGKPAAAPEPKKRPKKRLLKRLLARTTDVLVLLAIVGVAGYSTILKPEARVTASSNLYHPTETYEQAIEAKLQDFRNHNKLTFDESGLSRSLREKYPEITSMRVRLPIVGQKPSFNLTIGLPSFQLTSQGKAYLVDEQGVVVGLASSVKDSKKLPQLIDDSGFKIELGKPALNISGVTFVQQLLAQAKQAKAPVKSLRLPRLAQELQLRTKDKPYFVKFFLGGEPSRQIGQFIAARQHFAKNKISPKLYLDVRVNGKIFYK